MRIISGLNKGKKLIMPNDKTTRPLKDMAKESIFNILAHAKYINFHLKDSKVLDLFSGIGSFGLECISRGSKFVFFLENYSPVLEILRNNITNLKYENKSKVINIDAFKISKNTFKIHQKFQIIFCDPPYKEKKIELLIKKIIEMDILEKDGIVIIHRKKGDLDNYPKKFKVIDKKSYGLSTFVFGKKSN
ncbi:16S rRNA (guanine(966)-N(2))-methyltransferase RsmD [Candidatus Pelagibacter sp.]|nr:16S rRNA (guanine(966)-N(2))-methyltransferase RsmD [Candidatus Pelagibacter sp.]